MKKFWKSLTKMLKVNWLRNLGYVLFFFLLSLAGGTAERSYLIKIVLSFAIVFVLNIFATFYVLLGLNK
jgi:hypothetical protein